MTAAAGISVQSPAFGEGQPIPRRHTCDRQKTSPPLRWTGLPAGTGSVAVVSTPRTPQPGSADARSGSAADSRVLLSGREPRQGQALSSAIR
jgi:hypothetical protein